MAAPHVHLRGLNAEQRRAASHTEGPLLVLAGAGSGKTRTIVHRIAHLIRANSTPPSSIVALTFTNRAAEEMRARVHAFVGADARQVALSTFHSLGMRILREHGARLGLPRRFAIFGGADQLAALKTACGEVSVDDDRFDLKRVMRQISDWKTRRIVPDQACAEVGSADATGTRADDYAVLAADAYPRYEEVLRASGAVDFDDLLLLPVQLLEAHEDVRIALWKRWHYVMVDEYQDTNAVQLDLARLLAGARRNLCVVGDDDQSIYAFRGADLGNILEFERHFPGAKIIKLEENYRSTRRILEVANAIIAGNPHRHPKRLRTANGIGAQIDYHELPDEGAEAEMVAREITLRRLTSKLKWGEFAVLYRTNTQSRALEEVLRARNVPYRVVGGTSFFDRKEVADAVAYLRAVAFPRDEIALRRIINYPSRGIGRSSVLRVAGIAQEQKRAFADVLRETNARQTAAAPPRAIADFLELLDRARGNLADAEAAAHLPPGKTTPIASWVADLLNEIGIEAAIRTDPRNNAKTADARVANLRDLVGSITRYERRTWDRRLGLLQDPAEDDAPEYPTLADALGRLALSDLDEDDEDERADSATVALMTLHSAKGLEFSDVFIIGLEEGILPHTRSLEDEKTGAGALAEERRLLYVGITRARQRLTLSRCLSRRRGGAAQVCLPSRYLAEIPTELLDVKTLGTPLPAEQSAELRKNFFSQMKEMLGD
jgi:DNA helicase-2/ATP-dependent DNA helicase PcrA